MIYEISATGMDNFASRRFLHRGFKLFERSCNPGKS